MLAQCGVQGGVSVLLLLAEALHPRERQPLKELWIGLDLAAKEIAHGDDQHRQFRRWPQADEMSQIVKASLTQGGRDRIDGLHFGMQEALRIGETCELAGLP